MVIVKNHLHKKKSKKLKLDKDIYKTKCTNPIGRVVKSRSLERTSRCGPRDKSVTTSIPNTGAEGLRISEHNMLIEQVKSMTIKLYSCKLIYEQYINICLLNDMCPIFDKSN